MTILRKSSIIQEYFSNLFCAIAFYFNWRYKINENSIFIFSLPKRMSNLCTPVLSVSIFLPIWSVIWNTCFSFLLHTGYVSCQNIGATCSKTDIPLKICRWFPQNLSSLTHLNPFWLGTVLFFYLRVPHFFSFHPLEL